ncbi:MAG: hypothetical protein HZA90_13080 [Verrucomicrobia bacterium]|nr:hypothetical protein [Verrucomicrobiota bacterium]
MNDEFYIGWEERAPSGIGSQVRRAVAFLLAFAVVLAVLLAVAQRTIGVSVFEWGKVKSFSGVLRSQPYPHLLVPRPGAVTGQTSFSSYYLVKPFKFGLDAGLARRLDGKSVNLKGTLIYRGNQTMIEVIGDSIQQQDNPSQLIASASTTAPVNLGEQTLIGEIVDSKCYLGVMNPGQLTPHRACAIRCISGGIPPVLLVRQTNGPALYFLLVSSDGRPVNKQVLNLVAEPVQITGEVERQGELLILRADPATYRRLAR